MRLSSAAIIFISALLGCIAAFLAPGIERYTRDALVRASGEEPAPQDIAIIAIDEKSIQRFGQFPWPRTVLAQVVDRVAAAQPRAIAIDVLFTDPTTPDGDRALAQSIARAGDVVVAAQLTSNEAGESAWLRPLPELAKAAAATGHVNVHAESESVARELPVRSADDHGNALFAMPIEAVRVAQRVPESAISERASSIVIGSLEIPVRTSAAGVVTTGANASPLRALRMPIHYTGPAGSFAPVTYSVADLLDGSVSPSRIAGKYVLIGATAASLGERFAAPFTHAVATNADQHGTLMPGVEVLANALNTILRGEFYAEVSPVAAFLWATAISAITLVLLGVTQGRHESLRQGAVLIAVPAGVSLVSLWAYRSLRIFPPVTEQFVSFASAAVLTLLHRSLAAGSSLDAAIRNASVASDKLLSPPPPESAAAAVARLTGATRVAIVCRSAGQRYRVASGFGVRVPSRSQALEELRRELASGDELQEIALTENGDCVLLTTKDLHLSESAIRAARAIAMSIMFASEPPSDRPVVSSPQGLEARARDVTRLNAHILDRWKFADLAMRSTEDGLVIAGPDGTATFCNEAAAQVFRTTPDAIVGTNLLDRIAQLEPGFNVSEMLRCLLADRTPVEREISVRSSRVKRYTVRIAPVVVSGGGVSGLVASISDITKQQDLQQTKNDVISLVSHEMRTPLTAIQGMSELLATYEMSPERRRDLSGAINEESKRLTRMITQYLDITRLESGATVLRKSAIRPETLIERTLIMLEPVAAERGSRLIRLFAPDLPVITADSDFLARAVENLVSNAIKYGAPGTSVEVSVNASDRQLVVEVRDHGQGIAAEDQQRIFEKFYRVPRPENADIPGTGLGLPLVKEIAELHEGTVTVQSTPGEGSVFTFRIPITTAV